MPTAQRRRWTELVQSYNVEVVVALVVVGAQRCRHWWLAPGWPEVVEEVMRSLECPDRWYHSVIIAKPGVPRPLDLADNDDLRQLEAGPDLLSAEHAAYCILAGLKAVLRTHVCVLAGGEWTQLAELLESTVGHHQPRRARGHGWS